MILFLLVSQWTGISVSKLSQTELPDPLLNLNEHLQNTIIDQHNIIHSIIAVLRNRTELSKRNRPLGSFLFLGKVSLNRNMSKHDLMLLLL